MCGLLCVINHRISEIPLKTKVLSFSFTSDFWIRFAWLNTTTSAHPYRLLWVRSDIYYPFPNLMDMLVCDVQRWVRIYALTFRRHTPASIHFSAYMTKRQPSNKRIKTTILPKNKVIKLGPEIAVYCAHVKTSKMNKKSTFASFKFSPGRYCVICRSLKTSSGLFSTFANHQQCKKKLDRRTFYYLKEGKRTEAKTVTHRKHGKRYSYSFETANASLLIDLLCLHIWFHRTTTTRQQLRAIVWLTVFLSKE